MNTKYGLGQKIKGGFITAVFDPGYLLWTLHIKHSQPIEEIRQAHNQAWGPDWLSYPVYVVQLEEAHRLLSFDEFKERDALYPMLKEECRQEAYDKLYPPKENLMYIPERLIPIEEVPTNESLCPESPQKE